MKHIKIYSILLIFAGLILTGSNALAQDFALQDDLDALQADVDQNELDSDAADTALQADIDQNELDSDAADAVLQENINAEATVRTNADNALQADVDQNEADSDAADTALQADIDQNELDSDAADEQLQENINAEATARTNADNALQADVDQNELDSDAADEQLQENINAEATARTNADTALQADVDQNELDSDAADEQLQENINAEATARSNADTELQNNIDAEAGIRETMDTAIAGAIGLTAGEDGSYSYIANTEMNYINEATSVIEATEQLDRALYNESQARISADNELRSSIEQNQSDIDTNRKGIAMVAAMTHTTLLPGNNKALDIGIGYFESESAYSINYAGRLNENVQVNFSAASTSGLKDSAVRCSLGFQW